METNAQTTAITKQNPMSPIQTTKALAALCNENNMVNAFLKVAPAYLKPESFFSLFNLAATRNPKLLTCTRASIVDGMIQAGKLGLEISGLNNQGALVPFRNKKANCVEAVFIPGYQGLIGLVYKSGLVKSFDANEIYQNDFFECEYGSNSHLTHRPLLDGRGPMVGAYAIAKTITGGEIIKTAGMEYLAEMQKKYGEWNGKKKRDSAWNTDPGAMLCKTMVKRVCKFLDLSPDNDIACRLREAINYDNSLFKDSEPTIIDIPIEGKGVEGLENALAKSEAQRSPATNQDLSNADTPIYGETGPHGVTGDMIDAAEQRGNLQKDAATEDYEAESDAKFQAAQEVKEKGGEKK